jgi:DNA-binding CsgD family transcriptional regulator
MSERLRMRDLHAVIAGVQVLEQIHNSAEFCGDVLPLLRQLVPADIASFNVIDLSARAALRPVVDPSDAYFEGGEDVLGTYGHQNPLIQAHRLDAVKFSDYLTTRELHRLDIYDLIYAPTSVEHQIAFTVPASDRQIVGFALSRARHDFSERDRGVLNVLRPFVGHAYERVREHPRPLPADMLGLTPRQGEILRHLTHGRSSAQIALAMGISERTVHKHLENIYQRLDVPSRAAAVARGLGLQ